MSELFSRARELYHQGKWREFTHFFDVNFKNHLVNYQDHEWQVMELCFWCGMAYLKQNLFADAKQSFDLLAKTYPHSHLADEGKIQLLFAERKYQDIIRASFLFQEKYPTFWQSYYWRGNAFFFLERFDEALKEFSIVKLLYPNVVQGYEGICRTKKKQRERMGRAVLDKETLSDLEGLALHQNATHYQRFDYIESLLIINLPKKARKHLGILQAYPSYYFLAKGMIESWYHNYGLAYEYFNEALLLASNSSDKARILSNAFDSFKKLKKGNEYIHLADEVKGDSNQADVMLLWADSYSVNKPWRISWNVGIERLEEQIASGMLELPILVRYISYLIGLNQFHQAELILVFAVRQYADDMGINRLYCLVAHHKKEWQIAEERFNKYFAKFGNDIELFYPYINILYNLGKQEEIYHHYNKFLKLRFPTISENLDLNRLQVDLLLSKELGKYENVNKSAYNLGKIQNLMPTIKEIVHHKNNEVLVICFDGLRHEIDSQDKYNNFETTSILKDCINARSAYNDFDGFANNNQKFNYLLIRDFGASYCLLNFDRILETLKQKIAKIKSRYIVCMGMSGGAFSATLYAQHLGANVAFALMPRLMAFMPTPSLKLAHRKVQEHFDLTNPAFTNLPYLQKQVGGFSPKVYVAICENEASDVIGTYALDKSDPNLHISYFEGDVHALLEYVGTRNIYAELSRVIKAELENNFELPIQRDIFSQIDGYQDSSFDRLKNE